MKIKVQKKFIRTSPDKVRLIVKLISGQNLNKAMTQLKFVTKSASRSVLELLKSAEAAAKDKDLNAEDLTIKTIICEEGPRLKRRRIIHRGRATTINKRMSHITLVVTGRKEKSLEDKKNKSERRNRGSKSKSN